MQRHYAAFRSRGAEVVAIAQGTPEEADRYCGGLGVTFPCLGDPSKDAYARYALPRGSWSDILVEPMRGDAGLGLRRLMQASVRGSLMPHSDWFQLPGVAIVDRGGALRFYHRARHSADVPPADQLLAALGAGEATT